ncbi:probable serine/threonine-protein kinase qkgA [Anneissia japonica]|uniref:probable serine/threonine-protein kinase qkgA n=1 Tax=Anneissia japonica TaxID=1529436 RepID=UPI001425B65A|nr:probable serine/threonine-protein kinase qkgA [Anneissia japonica]
MTEGTATEKSEACQYEDSSSKIQSTSSDNDSFENQSTSSDDDSSSSDDDSSSSDNSSTEELPSETQHRIINRMLKPDEKKSGETGNEDMTYIWDFAGQQLYYITHRIFLTSKVVYLILFSLIECMYEKGKRRIHGEESDVMTYDMTNIEIIKYWMRLIYTYAIPVETQDQQLRAKKPQIVLVGTHSESLEGTSDDKKKQIKEQFKIIFNEIKGTPYEGHVVREMYAIDNKFPLKSVMLKTLKQDVGGFLKAMPKTIPLKWLDFQSQIQEIGRTAIRMTYVKVCEVATKCGISVENLIHILNYLHDLGIILYFENNRILRHTVITNPRKLIEIFKKIITVVEPYDSDKWPKMMTLWNKLDDEGILEEDLVRHLWRDEVSQDESSFEVFLELMKQFGLLCEQKNVESRQRSFFVPCRLKRSKESLSIKPDTDGMVSIYMASEDFIPDSIFHPLVVSLIRMVQDMGYTAKLELFSNNAIIALGRDHILSLGPVVINNKPSLKLEVLHKPIDQEGDTNVAACEPSPRVCMQVHYIYVIKSCG